MTYANYGGYSYMGIERPALVRAFSNLRQNSFAARLGLSFNESYSMPSNVVPDRLARYGQRLTTRTTPGEQAPAFGTHNLGATHHWKSRFLGEPSTRKEQRNESVGFWKSTACTLSLTWKP